jgi:hypothetical protein
LGVYRSAAVPAVAPLWRSLPIRVDASVGVVAGGEEAEGAIGVEDGERARVDGGDFREVLEELLGDEEAFSLGFGKGDVLLAFGFGALVILHPNKEDGLVEEGAGLGSLQGDEGAAAVAILLNPVGIDGEAAAAVEKRGGERGKGEAEIVGGVGEAALPVWHVDDEKRLWGGGGGAPGALLAGTCTWGRRSGFMERGRRHGKEARGVIEILEF